MSFLNLRKNKKAIALEKAPVISTPKKLAVSGSKTSASNAAALFVSRPRISEKATFLTGVNCYAFEVPRTANKHQIAQAVKALYGVIPKHVRVLPIPKKVLYARGKVGTTGGGKKAYVFLNKGEKIEIA
ncbi:MAG: large subunit ribosomal protein L23 [Parcubacteria group bacterium Gr01-1014_17]|nr:MAG: large subunit ribosomal protein L23 [Parcubacteria group bacterium Gr01-1014_17]